MRGATSSSAWSAGVGGPACAGLLHDLRKPVLNIQHSLDELAEALGDFAQAAPALATSAARRGCFSRS